MVDRLISRNFKSQLIARVRGSTIKSQLIPPSSHTPISGLRYTSFQQLYRSFSSGKEDEGWEPKEDDSVPDPTATSQTRELATRSTVVPKHPVVLVLPLINRPVFPGIVSPYTVTNKHLIAAIKKQYAKEPYVGLFLRKQVCVLHLPCLC